MAQAQAVQAATQAAQMMTAPELLGVLLLAGLLGMLGQGARVIAGLKKMNDAAQASAVSSTDLFMASRLVVSLIVGFIAGVIAVLSLGVDQLLKVDPGNIQLLLGIAAAGYVGPDFIDAFVRNLDKVKPPEFKWPLPGEPQMPQQTVVVPGPVPTPGPTPQRPVPPNFAQSMPFVGRMSHFGGPNDSGVGADEPLALLFESDLAQFSEYFLPFQPPGTTGLARRLNPDAFYIACRWDYLVTPKAYLKTIKVQVTNPANGRSALAQPVDWGPHERTGRVADLSPGLERGLGLVTDQECRVLVPLPADVIARPQQPRPGQLPLPQIVIQHLSIMANESDIRRHFGDIRTMPATPRGHVRILGSWPQENIVAVVIPELQGLEGMRRDGKVDLHKAIAPATIAAFAEIGRRGLVDRILTWGGSYVPRHIDRNPERALSRHTWGIAFDINATWNGLGAEPASKGERGAVVELVPIFESFGFAWGGRFRRPDGMHFEFAKNPTQT